MQYKKIFICSKEQDIKKCCQYFIKYNYIPISPYLYFLQFFENIFQRQKFILQSSMKLIDECNSFFVFGEINEIMKHQIEYAKSINKQINYLNEQEMKKMNKQEFFNKLMKLCKEYNVTIFPGDETMIYPSIFFDFHDGNQYMFADDEIDFNKKNLFNHKDEDIIVGGE